MWLKHVIETNDRPVKAGRFLLGNGTKCKAGLHSTRLEQDRRVVSTRRIGSVLSQNARLATSIRCGRINIQKQMSQRPPAARYWTERRDRALRGF